MDMRFGLRCCLNNVGGLGSIVDCEKKCDCRNECWEREEMRFRGGEAQSRAWASHELSFLEYVVGMDGIKTAPRKVPAVWYDPALRDVHDLRQFLRLAWYL